MYKPVTKTLAISVCLFGGMSVYAAQPVDMGKQPVSILTPYVSAPSNNLRARSIKTDEIKETRRATDMNDTTHIRMQQFHAGYPVWGAESVAHVPASKKRMTLNLAVLPSAAGTSMNGTMYRELDADLAAASAQVFNDAQADKAKNKALELAKATYGASDSEVRKHQLMVYVDENNKAHWAFLTNVYLDSTGANKVPANPTYILDAVTFDVYKSWNDIKTMDHANGGGYGGNTKTDKLVYDGLPNDLAALSIERDGETCYLVNEDVKVFDGRKGSPRRPFQMNYNCGKPDAKHNNVYWDGSMDSANGGFSPANDALYAGSVIQQLYKQWYKVPMLANRDGSPMPLKVFVHYGVKWENAEWDDVKREIRLGDGEDWAYPLTSLGVVAHEVSHGFTTQHSDLIYADQSGSMNESFSDMAAQAAESFAVGKNTWQIGAEIVKEEGAALRYIDQPSKDCPKGAKPGSGCSIDSADQYKYLVRYGQEALRLRGDSLQSYIVHLASGVYNRAFYLLANADGWNVRKAFGVMLHANSFYWTGSTDFNKGACGVLKSTQDLHYDTAAVVDAFSKVGIDTKTC